MRSARLAEVRGQHHRMLCRKSASRLSSSAVERNVLATDFASTLRVTTVKIHLSPFPPHLFRGRAKCGLPLSEARSRAAALRLFAAVPAAFHCLNGASVPCVQSNSLALTAD